MSEEFGQVSNIYRLRKILERAVEEKFKGDVDITDGGTSLNGAELKQQGIAEMERLDQEIGNFAEGGTPHSFVIG